MSYFRQYCETMEQLRQDGVSREEVLGVLEFDSDFNPDPAELKAARDHVYGKPEMVPLVTPEAFAGVVTAITANAARDRKQGGSRG